MCFADAKIVKLKNSRRNIYRNLLVLTDFSLGENAKPRESDPELPQRDECETFLLGTREHLATVNARNTLSALPTITRV